jgi:flagellar hook assembly protein FlgD
VSGVGNEGQEPLSYALRQNYPNPFNPSTVITYSIPKEAHVKIEVYSILGQKVASLFDQAQTAGVHSIAWNAQGAHGQKLSSGVYILRMQSGSFSQVRKMMLVR